MRYRRFGKTERSLSLFSLGTMRFDSAATAQTVLSSAIAQGINHIETAPAYGASERYIGQALSAIETETKISQRSQLTITSKLTPTTPAKDIEPAISPTGPLF